MQPWRLGWAAGAGMDTKTYESTVAQQLSPGIKQAVQQLLTEEWHAVVLELDHTD